MTPHTIILHAGLNRIGGIEKQTLRIAQGFETRRGSVTLIPYTQIKDHWGYQHMLRAWLSSHSSDILFGMDRFPIATHLRAGNGVHAMFLKQMNKSRLSFKHQLVLYQEKQAFESPLLRTLFTNSHMVKNQILAHYAIDSKKIAVVHNGVEWNEFALPFDTWQQKKTSSSFHFLFIGNGYRRKGLDLLLTAFAKIRECDVILSVVGRDAQELLYRQLAKKLGIQSQVRFLGEQKEIIPFYQQADALVIPSRYDPFANVTTEALAMGLLVISSQENGGSEILIQANGIVLSELSADALQLALKQALLRPKTETSASFIRQTVRHLDFSNQNKLLIEQCLD